MENVCVLDCGVGLLEDAVDGGTKGVYKACADIADCAECDVSNGPCVKCDIGAASNVLDKNGVCV